MTTLTRGMGICRDPVARKSSAAGPGDGSPKATAAAVAPARFDRSSSAFISLRPPAENDRPAEVSVLGGAQDVRSARMSARPSVAVAEPSPQKAQNEPHGP